MIQNDTYTPPEIRKKQIPTLKLKGLTDEQIAQKLGVTRVTIARDKKQINMTHYLEPLLEQLLKEYEELMHKTLPITDSEGNIVDTIEDREMLKLAVQEKGKLLRKLLPQEPLIQVENIEEKKEVNINLGEEFKEYGETLFQELLRRRRLAPNR